MEMDADPEVMRYIGMCSVLVRETGEYAGWVTLAVPAFLPEILPAVEIGWRLRREQWGHGYATEAAAELLRFGLTGAGLDRVVSIRHIDNARSERVMDKLGLRFESQTTVPATGQPVAVHAIARRRVTHPPMCN
jgi:RimJ/RimL family protein N-acetyltransferase